MNKCCLYCKSISCEPLKCDDIFSNMMKIQEEVRKPFFKGYSPQFYFKKVSPFRSDTPHEWEFN